MEARRIKTDVLIVGGGAAGIYSALTIAENSSLNVTIADKGNIKRSGCLAAGVNALNAHINKGQTEDDYVDYVKREFKGIVREDLVYTMAKGLNKVTRRIEAMGLPILKNEDGSYAERGKRSIKINGENIKPMLAAEVKKHENISVIESINIFDYIKSEDSVVGAYGFSIKEELLYVIEAGAVVCATGGAAGIYRPNNPGYSRHKIWYSPFNTGAGYAMGIRAGAEMTSFEMRFIALRCKDTIAPTGTIAQGADVEHVNSKGEAYIKGRASTIERLRKTIAENVQGRGPCYLKTKGIDKESEDQLFRAYLNMAPSQALKWHEENKYPSEYNVEIEGTEPYITGGHSGAGYWIDSKRRTTVKGLYAAGDVAGGNPKKYVTGSFVEGELAAMAIIDDLKGSRSCALASDSEVEAVKSKLESYFGNCSTYDIEEVEEALQKVMDEYAGGISKNYGYSESRLNVALEKLEDLEDVANSLKARDNHELLFITEILDRILVSKVLVAHMKHRKETRWKVYQENLDYPELDDRYGRIYINSEYSDGNIVIKERELVKKEDVYEH